MLVCQGEELPCHRTILMASCPTLAQGVLSAEGKWVMRNSEGKEVNSAVVRDPLYTGDIPKGLGERARRWWRWPTCTSWTGW